MVSDGEFEVQVEREVPRLSIIREMIWSGIALTLTTRILAPLTARDSGQEECRVVVTARLWWIGTQDKAFVLAFHDVMVSAFEFGSN